MVMHSDAEAEKCWASGGRTCVALGFFPAIRRPGAKRLKLDGLLFGKHFAVDAC